MMKEDKDMMMRRRIRRMMRTIVRRMMIRGLLQVDGFGNVTKCVSFN